MAAPAPLSPLAPKTFPDLPPVEGVKLATGSAGIKYRHRTDVLLALFDEGTQVAGVFTKSKCPSAPVDWCRANLAGGRARALVVNSGNANAFTGRLGVASVQRTAAIAAHAAGAKPNEIFLASTGVIGEPLDAEKFDSVLGDLAGKASSDALLDAARAIMTTDTFPKVATATARLGTVDVVINGIAKGAGMIAPDMATMLSFIFTDAPIAAPVLQSLLSKHVETSFNATTVDGDTSTSDTLLLFATGAAGRRGGAMIVDAQDPRLGAFDYALHDLMLDLAQQVVRDGEGARKFVKVTVEKAETPAAAKRVALSIANSPLVKTAVAGEDANWGRIVMAVGKAGEKADRDQLDIWFGGFRVAHAGQRDPGYSEAEVSAYMKQQHIDIRASIGVGEASATVWTCDLTKEYIAINGDYRS